MAKYHMQYRMNSGMVYTVEKNSEDIEDAVIEYAKVLSDCVGHNVETFTTVTDINGQHYIINLKRISSIDYILQNDSD